MRLHSNKALALALALLAVACDNKPSEPAPRPRSSRSTVAAVSAPRAPALKPAEHFLHPRPRPAQLGPAKLSPQVCQVEGVSFTHKVDTAVLAAIEVVGDKLYVADGKGAVHALVIKAGEECKLTLDRSFGKGGKLEPEQPVLALSRGAANPLIASTGVHGSYAIRDGHSAYTCAAPGLVRMHPSEPWGLATLQGATVQKVRFGDGACTFEPWAMKASGGKRTGPFSVVGAIGFLEDMVLLGGRLSDKEEKGQVVVGFDDRGTEKLRIDAGRGNRFEWVHDLESCAGGICVLDGNARMLSLWSRDGERIGQVRLNDLLDLRLPWVPSMATAGQGQMYMIAGQSRGRAPGGAEGFIYRVSGL